MMIAVALAMLPGFTASPTLSPAASSGTYGAVNLTGLNYLYDAAGNTLTTSCKVESASFTLTYFNESDGFTASYPYYGPYTTTVRVLFSSNAWQTYRTGGSIGAIGFKACNYSALNTAPMNQFIDPASWPSPLDPYTSAYLTQSGLQIVASSEAHSVVKPMKILYSSLTVDSADPTGKTGKISWSHTHPNYSPWDGLPYPSYSGNWFGAAWVFPKWGSNGTYSMRYVYSYPLAL